MSDSSHLKARNLLADAFVAHGLGSATVNSVRLPGRGMTEESKAALEVVEALLLQSATRNEIGTMYEQLRKVIDGGNESMTHSDALELLQKWAPAAEEPVLYSSDVDFREYPQAVPGAMHAGRPKGVEATSIKHGVVIICDSERSMHLNRERALAGLRAMIKHKEGL